MYVVGGREFCAGAAKKLGKQTQNSQQALDSQKLAHLCTRLHGYITLTENITPILSLRPISKGAYVCGHCGIQNQLLISVPGVEPTTRYVTAVRQNSFWAAVGVTCCLPRPWAKGVRIPFFLLLLLFSSFLNFVPGFEVAFFIKVLVIRSWRGWLCACARTSTAQACQQEHAQ